MHAVLPDERVDRQQRGRAECMLVAGRNVERDNLLPLVLARYMAIEPLGEHNELETDTETRRVFGLLVGASFSLWRAVFLAQPERDWVGTKGILGEGFALAEQTQSKSGPANSVASQPVLKSYRYGRWLVQETANFRVICLPDLPQRGRLPDVCILRPGPGGCHCGISNSFCDRLT